MPSDPDIYEFDTPDNHETYGVQMEQGQLSWITNYIWGNADDVLGDLYVRCNVQDILENFEFRNQIPRLSRADALGTLIEKLTSLDVNFSPESALEQETEGLLSEIIGEAN
jgi:hypothetical protein